MRQGCGIDFLGDSQAIAGPLIAIGEITRLSRDIIRPYYLAKRDKAMAAIAEFFPEEAPYSIHE
ncbi:MAG: hypothetical protein RLZZ408_614, partial [Verrucomicrobiota bacterium]